MVMSSLLAEYDQTRNQKSPVRIVPIMNRNMEPADGLSQPMAGLWSEASLEGNAADRGMPVELKFSSVPFHQLELMEPAVGFEPTTA
jgi:hypothetical protein